MKVISNIIKYIVLIILIISIILTVATTLISATILNKDYILSKLEETDYYTNIYNQVESNFEKYIYQSGLDENVIKDIISKEEVKADTIQIINNIYSNEEVVKIDVSKIEDRLEKNIYNSLPGQTVSSTNKKSIEQFINTIVEEYKDTIIHTKYENNINEIMKKIIDYSSKIKNTLIIADVILIVLLLVLSIKNIQKGIAKLGIALSATGFFYILTNIIIKLNVKIDHITILNDGFSTTLRTILSNIMNKMLGVGIILILIGSIKIFVTNIALYKKSDKIKAE